MLEQFAVMVKPVGSLCNLNCSYCYYSGVKDSRNHTDITQMPDTVLESLIRQYIEANKGPVVRFTWHGGEPSLAGIDFYRRVISLQKHYLPDDWSCRNNLQTNGVLLDERWCAFIAESGFEVGLSIDATESLHNEYRKDYAGHGSYTLVSDAIRRLQKHGVQPDLLCTVTSAIARNPLPVYRALREFATGWIQFIPIVRRFPDGTITPDSVGADEYGDFLCAVFDEWVYHDVGRLMVQLFAETMLVISGASAGLCWMSPVCGRALIVEMDGTVYSCDHFVNNAHLLGNITEKSHSLSSLAASPAQLTFGYNKRDLLPAQCLRCRWLHLCNGACPKDRFISSEDGENGLNYLCAGLKRFFSHAEQPLKKIVQLSKQGKSPQTIMSGLIADARTIWKNIGRNDPCPCGSGRKAKHCCMNTKP